MDVQIIFNSSSSREGLSVGWGLSFLIDNRIIFDTGENVDLLANNMDRLEVDLSRIEAVVISHDHWDHTSGLWHILKERPGINVYGCPGFSDEFKTRVKSANGRLMENSVLTEVSEDIFATGEMKGLYKNKDISEQALILDTKAGLTVITGCAHPGVLEILDVVKKYFPKKDLYCVMGGFHLMNKHPRNIDFLAGHLKKIGVAKVGPTHCSGAEAEDIFRAHYADKFLTMNAGETQLV